MKIKQRMYIAYGVIMIFLSIFAYVIISQIMKLHDSSNQIVREYYQNVEYSNRIQFETENISGILKDLVLHTDPEYIPQVVKELQDAKIRVLNALHDLKYVTPSHEGRDIIEKAELEFENYLQVEQNVVAYIQKNERHKAIVELDKGRAIRQELRDTIDEIISQQENKMEEILIEGEEAFVSITELIFISIVSGIFLISSTNYWVIKSFNNRVSSISKAIQDFDINNLETLPRIHKVNQDEMNEFVEAFNAMAEVLEEQAKKEKQLIKVLEEEGWIKSILVEFSVMFQGARTVEALSQGLVSKLCPISNALYGVVYLVEDQVGRAEITRTASYAYTGEEVGVNTIQIREGIIGQCVAEKQKITLANFQENSFVGLTSLGLVRTKIVSVYPIIYEKRVLGVIEFGLMRELTELEARMVEQVLTNVGASIYSILSNMKVEQLLKESQNLTEELQAQAEELQAQSEELRVQQEELINTNEKLEEHHKITEQKSKELERAKKVLEEQAEQLTQTSKYKSEFLANMSHELRTPLNSMLILTQMLADNPRQNLTPEQVEWSRTIQMSGKELLLLINDILDVSKLEAGKMELSLGVTTVTSLVEYVEVMFRPMAKAKNIKFTIEVEENFPQYIFTDYERLKQILTNLVSNAFKFTEHGYVSVRFFYESTKKRLNISVIDTGVGIPSDKQQVIFDAFRQADGTTSRKYGGTGLGLAISKEMAQLLGGQITVKSVVGEGSTFLVTLPHHHEYIEKELNYFSEIAVTKHKLTPKVSVEQPLDTAVEGAYDLAGYKVLVVDDDMRNIFALTTVLEKEQMQVVHAENGLQAVKVLEDHQDFDIVLMDIMMPEMDGYDAIKMIRENSIFADLPIIALTAKAAKNDRDKCIEVGASDYISKPVNIEQLLSLIQVWLFNRG